MTEQFRCQRCGGFGDGIIVGEDPITNRILCGHCRDQDWIERAAGKDWGEKTSTWTDPRVTEPLPEPTLEEALGEEGARKYREDMKKKENNDNSKDSSTEERLGKLEEIMAKILGKLEEK